MNEWVYLFIMNEISYDFLMNEFITNVVKLLRVL